jgi:glycosyltransferase involved in cell wall biosynthesis
MSRPGSGFALGGRAPRIALFSGNYNYTRDGANQALNRLVDHLEQTQGAKVRVYSPTSRTPAFEPKGELVSAPSVRIPLRPDYRMALGLGPKVRHDLESFQPDLVHVSAPDLLGQGAVAYAREQDVPVVASLHTFFETYLEYYGLGWLRPGVERRLQAFYESCDFVLAPNPTIAEQMARGGLGDRVRIWGRGVDHGLFNPARRDLDWRRAQGFADDEVVVVSFGRIVLEKGLAVFAEAFERVKAEHPKARALVIGDGPARPWMQKRLPRAVFTGLLSGPQLGRAVASGDILLNPSITETFSNVVLEAMSAGLAVVCADAPNNRALLRHGESGLLTAARDAAAYAQAGGALIRDPAQRTALAAAAHAASAAYGWSSILDGVVDIYAQALRGKISEQPIAA